MANILISGASGNIGTVLTEYLKDKHTLTLVDVDFTDFPDHLKNVSHLKEIDLTVPDNVTGLLDGIDYVIHLAGDPRPDAEFYDSLLDLNYKVPHNMFKEAVKEDSSVKRTIFASSVHAIGGYPENVQVKTSDYPHPEDLYGVSKVYMEALASYHAYKYGKEFIGIRVGGFDSDISPGVANADGLATHLSKGDMCHLIDCCLTADLKQPFLLVNGVSNNRFPRMDISQAYFDIGYEPKDDAFEIHENGHYDFKEEEPIKIDPED
ncbi:nucleoside-diphosphate sugar epimerase [Jeotgalibaca sp. PTS2502]|uniref:NAD-dependent epimerase/dehydratase family protein n=1 Tax=Jeotgalibaca sp. PTS2502 TaxID=1903686 RepID=UPI0009736580|nr:NAD(P)-dependent oxidoreductase [Jeotgalibaca sp. PTS2502]APZ48492.1 nucleoside-diphosphate sugar epimerase [Jeotgalibaca sp. PTS2502]